MTNALTTTIPETTLINPLADTLHLFKSGVDALLAKRHYFIQQVLPKLQENQDYYTIKGKKSLAKGGAEKLASIYNLAATFEQDNSTMSAFSSVPGLIAYVCTLFRGDQVAGQGRGAATLDKNLGDPNKTVKMATKSAFIDAVIRSTGLSDIFTQDIQDMPVANVLSPYFNPKSSEGHNTQMEPVRPLETAVWNAKPTSSNDQAEEFGFNPATEKQKSYLHRLVSQRFAEPEELEANLQAIEGFSKAEASERIEELLNS